MRRGVYFTLFLLVILSPWNLDALSTSPPSSSEKREGDPAQYEIILEREEQDGSITTEVKKEIIWAVEDFWNKYQEWELIDQNEQQIIFRKPYEKG